jgi:hypothetical protein
MAAILGEQEKKADGRLYSYLMANTIVVQFTGPVFRGGDR